MRPTEPLALYHSWPLVERKQHFSLGCVLDLPPFELRSRITAPGLPRQDVGRWQYDLAKQELSWSDEVFDLFGLPRAARPTRDETLALYSQDSRVVMERLRAYAIKHQRGFTLDAEIRPRHGGTRCMRLIAAPIVEDGRVVLLHGLKWAI